VYRLAREFRRRMYRLAHNLPESEKFNLASQIRRAAVSLTNNIAEGYGRYHYQENVQFCRQARGSLCELIDDLNACRDESYVSDEEYQHHRQQALRVLKVLNCYIEKTRELGKR
jgi:four helix bundle protein